MPTRPLEIFFSYRSTDRTALKHILTQLSPLRKKGLIDPWYDGQIEPGDEWRRNVRKHIRSARIIVLLVSADYFASSECEDEMGTALRRRKAEGTVVLPVILHYCLWPQTPLVDLEVLPVGGNPIDSWTPRAKGYVNVAMGILRKVEKLYGPDGHPPPSLKPPGPPERPRRQGRSGWPEPSGASNIAKPVKVVSSAKTFQ